MTKSYAGGGLTIRAEKGELVRYRKQQMSKPRNPELPYIELPENEAVTLHLNENLMECAEVEAVGYLPPKETTQWKVFISVSQKKNGQVIKIEGKRDGDLTDAINLSHIYLDVDGKKVYLSGDEEASGGMEWYLGSQVDPTFKVEEYCSGFVSVL